MRVLVADSYAMTVYIKQPEDCGLDKSFRGAFLDDIRAQKEQRSIMLGLDKHRGGRKKKRRQA